MKFPGHIEGLESFIHAGNIESKSDTGRLIAYLMRLCKWKAQQGLGEMKEITKSYNRQEIVDSQDHQCLEGIRNKKEVSSYDF